MFVPINSADMDAFKVEEWINRTRDDNGGVISPEFAMDVLGKTNHFAHIKKLINLIKKSCSDKNGELVADKVLAYKEFILSCVDGREHEGIALKGLQELADASGLREEFDKINQEDKLYDKKACEKLICVTTGKKLDVKRRVNGEDLEVLFYQVREDEYDVEEIKNIDLAGIKKLRFNYGDRVAIDGVYNLPKILDFSNCSNASISRTDIKNVEEIKWPDFAGLYSSHVYLDKVDFSDCVYLHLECVTFAFGELKLGGNCILDQVFFPEKLDLSKCESISAESDLPAGTVKEIKFKNKDQKQKLMEYISDFNGKFVYEEEEVGLDDKLNKFLGREV